MGSNGVTFGVGIGFAQARTAEIAREVEALGFDHVQAGEHVQIGEPPRPTSMALPTLAVAGGATRRIRLVSGIVLLPLYHPVMLAKLATTVDVATGGRLVLGVGIGGESRQDFAAAGVPIRERASRANEGLALLRRLWTEDAVTFHGRHYDVHDVTINPRPVQQPHPPIWVAGRRDPAMRRAATLGDGWFPYLYEPEQYHASVGRIRGYAAEAGRDLSGFAWGLYQNICVGDSYEAAFRTAVERIGFRSYFRPLEEMVRAYCVTGTPEQCVEGVKARIEAGARHISFSIVSRDADDARRQVHLLAEKVVPALQS